MKIRDIEKFKQNYNNYGFEKIENNYVKYLKDEKQSWRVEIDSAGECSVIFNHKNKNDKPKFPSQKVITDALADVVREFGCKE